MKSNKKFNKVLSKSAALLVAGATIVGSGSIFSIYAADVNSSSKELVWSGSFTVNYEKFCKPQTPAPTKVPVVTSTPAPTKVPVATSTPAPTKVPAVTSTPAPTKVPVATSTPAPTKVPVATSTPGESQSSQTAYENKVLELVNIERSKQGLSPLQMDESLRKVARTKSQDMRQNNYFSHTSPTYGTPFEMMKQFGISYSAAAENIAKGQATPEAVVNAWMNSSGHRANILSSKYTHIGIGYDANGNYWTQMFIAK